MTRYVGPTLVAMLLTACAATPPATDGPNATSATASPPATLVQFRMIADSGAPDREAFEFEGETLYLASEAVATDRDLAGLTLTSVDDRWQLDVRFTGSGGVRFDQVLLEDWGHPIALVVDSRVWRVLDVRPQLGASLIRATIEQANADGTRLQGFIDARWP